MSRSIFTLACWFLLFFYGTTTPVSADDVSVTDYPFHVSLEYNNVHSCSGALLDERWILTAASCVYQNGLTGLNVKVGTSSSSQGGTEVEVRSITIHEDFTSYTYDNDIALLYIRGAVEFGEGVFPIETASSTHTIADGTLATVTGWVQDGAGNSAQNLTAVLTPIISQATCDSNLPAFKQLQDTMLCAGYLSSTEETCQGDSGAPLVYDEIVIGILSYGLGCYDGSYPSIYTRVSSYGSWISSNTGIIW